MNKKYPKSEPIPDYKLPGYGYGDTNGNFEYITGEVEAGKKYFRTQKQLHNIYKLMEESPFIWSGEPKPIYDDGKIIIFIIKED